MKTSILSPIKASAVAIALLGSTAVIVAVAMPDVAIAKEGKGNGGGNGGGNSGGNGNSGNNGGATKAIAIQLVTITVRKGLTETAKLEIPGNPFSATQRASLRVPLQRTAVDFR